MFIVIELYNYIILYIYITIYLTKIQKKYNIIKNYHNVILNNNMINYISKKYVLIILFLSKKFVYLYEFEEIEL